MSTAGEATVDGEATSDGEATVNDAALVDELRVRLKVPRSSDLPKAEHIGLALRLAREPKTDTTKGFWPSSIKSSATRTRRRMAVES